MEIPEQEWAASPAAAATDRPATPGQKTFLLYPLAVAVLVVLATALRVLLGR